MVAVNLEASSNQHLSEMEDGYAIFEVALLHPVTHLGISCEELGFGKTDTHETTEISHLVNDLKATIGKVRTAYVSQYFQ